MGLDIIEGVTATAPKVMIYGLSGVGKSTLASKLKNPLFLDFEGGLNYLGVKRTKQYQDLEKFYEDLKVIYHSKEHQFDTLVIDSVDWMVRKVVEKAAGISLNNLEETLNRSNGGYGNGKQVLENHIRTKLLPTLVALNKKGYGICLIAHADKKHIMDADGVDVEQISPKIDLNTMNVFVEWCDNVFYLKKDAEGKRKLVLESDNTALAKNRLGKTGEVDIDEVDINEVLKPSKEK